MWIGIISLFPEMFKALQFGIPGKAKKNALYDMVLLNPRDFTTDNYKTIDDRPYGGGPGMVMMAEPIYKAVQKAKLLAPKPATVIYVSPQGKPLTEEKAKALSQANALIFISGRYEGIDERVVNEVVDEEVSIGDYVLSGGELATMVVIDAMIRLMPGVLGDEQSAIQDSFHGNLLDCPHYTRPDKWHNQSVPTVLQSGNHAAIERWRKKQALGRTWLRRPDLLQKRTLTPVELKLLAEFKDEN